MYYFLKENKDVSIYLSISLSLSLSSVSTSVRTHFYILSAFCTITAASCLRAFLLQILLHATLCRAPVKLLRHKHWCICINKTAEIFHDRQKRLATSFIVLPHWRSSVCSYRWPVGRAPNLIFTRQTYGHNWPVRNNKADDYKDEGKVNLCNTSFFQPQQNEVM